MADSRNRAPRNTEREARENPLLPIAEALVAGNPSDAIVASEKAGQRSFVGSDTLPTEMHGNARAELEAAGVKFGEVVNGDPLFQYVELPSGWKKQGTSHDMWSTLFDETGKEVAQIFYKAAFYDRRAHLSMSH